MQTADNVARWFLEHNRIKTANDEADFISNLKLQKLLYYAQGFHLARQGVSLFPEPIIAWAYGPIVESVYDSYKNNGSDGIKVFEPPALNFSEREEDTLFFVQDAFGQFSAWKLSEMTHAEPPWKTTPRNNVITVDKIKSFFNELCAEWDAEFPMSEETRQCLADCRAGRNLIGSFGSVDDLFKSLGI